MDAPEAVDIQHLPHYPWLKNLRVYIIRQTDIEKREIKLSGID